MCLTAVLQWMCGPSIGDARPCFSTQEPDFAVLQIALDDVSLDDLWALDLNKLDGWRCVKENTTGDVKEILDSEEDSNSGDSDNEST